MTNEPTRSRFAINDDVRVAPEARLTLPGATTGHVVEVSGVWVTVLWDDGTSSVLHEDRLRHDHSDTYRALMQRLLDVQNHPANVSQDILTITACGDGFTDAQLAAHVTFYERKAAEWDRKQAERRIARRKGAK